jgi:hypothetical protein
LSFIKVFLNEVVFLKRIMIDERVAFPRLPRGYFNRFYQPLEDDHPERRSVSLMEKAIEQEWEAFTQKWRAKLEKDIEKQPRKRGKIRDSTRSLDESLAQGILPKEPSDDFSRQFFRKMMKDLKFSKPYHLLAPHTAAFLPVPEHYDDLFTDGICDVLQPDKGFRGYFMLGKYIKVGLSFNQHEDGDTLHMQYYVDAHRGMDAIWVHYDLTNRRVINYIADKYLTFKKSRISHRKKISVNFRPRNPSYILGDGNEKKHGEYRGKNPLFDMWHEHPEMLGGIGFRRLISFINDNPLIKGMVDDHIEMAYR